MPNEPYLAGNVDLSQRPIWSLRMMSMISYLQFFQRAPTYWTA
jgi:hypothetical protein